MLVVQALFYLFAVMVVASSIAVIFAKHPVHAVLYVILAFCNGAGLMLLLGAEFLAMIVIVIYVGAIAVFFLFVVMMLDVDFRRLSKFWQPFSLFALIIAAILVAEIVLAAISWNSIPRFSEANLPLQTTTSNNTEALALHLYTDYQVAVIICGLILLVAMIGAIVLSLRTRPNVKQQDILRQTSRSTKVLFTKPKSGAGLQ